jgi:hypothetical protein
VVVSARKGAVYATRGTTVDPLVGYQQVAPTDESHAAPLCGSAEVGGTEIECFARAARESPKCVSDDGCCVALAYCQPSPS